MSREEITVLEQVRKIIQESIAIPCTGCRYCTEGCPQHIAIPDYFAFCNDLHRFGPSQMRNVRRRFRQLAERNGKPSDCVKCGKCEERCPPASDHPQLSGKGRGNTGTVTRCSSGFSQKDSFCHAAEKALQVLIVFV